MLLGLSQPVQSDRTAYAEGMKPTNSKLDNHIPAIRERLEKEEREKQAKAEAEKKAAEEAEKARVAAETAQKAADEAKRAEEARVASEAQKANRRPPAASVDGIALMQQAGISPSDYQYVQYILGREGGFNRPCVVNGGAIDCTYDGPKAYGICQSKPGNKMASAGADWRTNPATQLRWCHQYAHSRYGSWAQAYQFWLANHWW